MPDIAATDEPKAHSTFVLFGSARSGTTLLASCLDLHDEIVVPDETDFIVPMAFVLSRVSNPRLGKDLIQKLICRTDRFSYSLGEYVSAWDIRKAVRRADYNMGSILDSVYQMVAKRAGKRFGGDKSPNDIGNLSILLQQKLQTSGIKIIHLVRDIRDVVLSLQHTAWAPMKGMGAPAPWQGSNLQLAKAFVDHPNYHRLRFEDLVVHPREELERLCRFLNVPFQEKMLDHENRGTRYRKVEHHRNIGQPFRPDRINVWRHEMSPEVRNRVEEIAGDALSYFGYSVSSAQLAEDEAAVAQRMNGSDI